MRLPCLVSLLTLLFAVTSSAQVFDRQTYNTPGKAGDFATADFNRDGKPDIITTDETDGSVTVFLNNGSGGFPSGGSQSYLVYNPAVTKLTPRRVLIVDVNGDGIPDVVTANCPASVSVLLSDGDGFLEHAVTQDIPGPGCPNSIAATYNPGDSLADLVLTLDTPSGAQTKILVLENIRGVGQWSPSTLNLPNTTKVFNVSAADYDLDGVYDYAVVGKITSGEDCLFLLFPFLSKPTRTLACATDSPGASTVELNNDGVPDLVFPFSDFNSNTGAFALINDGSGRFLSQQLNLPARWTTSRTASAGDFNVDGLPDILIALSQTTGARQYVYFGSTGAGHWGSQVPGGPVDGDPVATVAADFNVDGKMDFAILGAPSLLQIYTNTFSGAPECSASAASVKICAPADGSNPTSPVLISAAATGGGAIIKMLAYIDNKQVAASSSGKLTGSVPVNPGVHNLVVNAWDLGGRLFQARSSFTVGTGAGPCPPNGVGVRICKPAAGTTVGSPFALAAGAQGNGKNIVAMKAYVDGARMASSNIGSLNTIMGGIPGLHNLTVNAWDSSGAVYTANQNFSIAACSDPTFDKQVNFCSPADQASTRVPISVKTRWDGKNITYTRVYIDAITACNAPNSATVNCYVTLAPGTHKISVTSWIGTGESINQAKFFTVQ